MSRTQYLDLDDRTEDVRELMRKRPRETQDFLEKYELSWIYHECALEGMVQTQPALEQLFHFMESEEFLRMHPFKQATHSHHRFMEIFPFSDLSGKVGRMMMNLILIRAGYMPLVIHSMDRETYYDALRMNATQFGQVMMQSMDNALDNAFKFFLPKWDETSRRRAASE